MKDPMDKYESLDELTDLCTLSMLAKGMCGENSIHILRYGPSNVIRDTATNAPTTTQTPIDLKRISELIDDSDTWDAKRWLWDIRCRLSSTSALLHIVSIVTEIDKVLDGTL